MAYEPLVVDALAVYRLTRLLTRDTITEDVRGCIVKAAYESADAPSTRAMTEGTRTWPLRAWATLPQQDDNAPKLATFVTCPWCVGVWVAAGVGIARMVAPRTWNKAARVLAVAGAAGLLSHNLDR